MKGSSMKLNYVSTFSGKGQFVTFILLGAWWRPDYRKLYGGLSFKARSLYCTLSASKAICRLFYFLINQPWQKKRVLVGAEEGVPTPAP
jgi:hypothetical protein